jgi:branched-chain amino acid transport system ATP-binding protein
VSLLEVRGLSKAFGALRAVAGIDFDVAPGEAVALIGPNGAGKTTCFNMLSGQLRPDAGSIRFGGRELAGLPPHKICRLGVGRTFQVAATFPSMTTRENIQTTLLSHRRRLWSPWPPARGRFVAETDALLEQVGMTADADRASGILSYGDLKRLDLAMALAGDPKLLLMDEPTAGVAIAERHALMALIVAIVRERHISVLFTEHDMDVVFGHAARVIVMHRGRIVTEGPPDAVRADAEVKEIYLGYGDDRGDDRADEIQ